jgi:plastocyanin
MLRQLLTKSLKTTFILTSFLMSTAALGGVVFTPSVRAPNPSDGEEFPESHFGQGYAARQVEDMESPDEESGKNPATASRGIASVGENPNSGMIQDTAIVTSQASESQDIPQSLVSRNGVQEVSVIASDLGYFPKTIFVSRDVPVRMYVTGASKNTLCIMMDSFQVRKQVKSQKIEEITFVPKVPGKYRFYCPVNGMEGNLVVRELSSSFAQQMPEQSPSQQSMQAPSSRGRAASARSVPQVQSGWTSAMEPGLNMNANMNGGQ